MFIGRNQSTPRKIVILRPLQLGDLLCAVPAFRVLRSAFPNAEITLIGLPWAAAFVDRFHQYLDQLLVFPGFPGFPERTPDIAAFPNFLMESQSRYFDLALQMHGSGNLSNSIITLIGAKKTAGFMLAENFCPDPETFLAYPDKGHEIDRMLALMEFLRLQPAEHDLDRNLEFPLTDDDWQSYAKLQEQWEMHSDSLVVIHPGARDDRRRWSASKFAAAADALASTGMKIVVTGSADEKDVVQQVIAQMSTPAVDLSGQTTLGTLGAVLASSRLLIANDTGVSHIATALHVPSVILFSASDPERWGPLNKDLHHRILQAGSVEPQTVINEAEQLLQKERQYVS